MKKALVAMSGGVDSSATAACMLAAGYAVVGATMQLHNERAGTCGSSTEIEDARGVADRLGIPFQVLDYTADFTCEVMDRFVTAYEAGLTPNPCIECNRHMKFARLLEAAKAMGCDTVATGHYARVEYDEAAGRYRLKKARNLAKDQTYVLYFLTQEQLAHIVFPLGDMESKEQVRQLAEGYGFANARKRDSQDICFVPDGDYAAFIRRHTGREYPPGDFVDSDGKVLGQHKGLIRYTIGQRKGLGLSLPAPLYVCRKDMEKNRVILTREEDLYASRLVARNVNWIAGAAAPKPGETIRAAARTRYSAKEAPASITVLEGGRMEVVFDTPQRAITPGQAVVLYDGDEVLGGGTILE